MWRIFRFALNEIQPAVIHLQLHLENYQNMSFEEDVDLRNVLSNAFIKKTMLMEFFTLNKSDESVQKEQYTYKEFPEHFVWLQGERRWKMREQRHVIGRIVLANPMKGESLRRLFATILVYLPPNDPRGLWMKFKELMQEDFRRLNLSTDNQIDLKTLQHISRILESMGKNINRYGLVPRFLKFDDENVESREVLSERHLEVSVKDLQAAEKLNGQQKRAFEMIKEKVYNNQPGLFFIDSPGGTGKTFLYRVLLAEVRSKGYIALANESSGVAAALILEFR